MRIVCISDTHNRLKDIAVPDGDILIHAGDLTGRGTIQEVARELQRLAALPHLHKVLVAGNHDFLFQQSPDLARSILPDSVTYLEDALCVVAGLRVYGSPWQPEFGGWAFNLPRGEALRKKWDLIPSNVDILVTHGPPLGVLDGDDLGCEDLLAAVTRVKPRLHVFGHIHEGRGRIEVGGTLFINAACLDERYDIDPWGGPIVVEL